jgi:hypothetical protein
MNQVIGYPFVAHVEQSLRPTIQNPIEFLNKYYHSGYSGAIYELLKSGTYKSMGYRYDFKPLLKRFVYKQYGNWTEAYAPNKTKLRNAVYGKIDEIVELTKK